MPRFSILSSQTAKCARIRNKADMGLENAHILQVVLS